MDRMVEKSTNKENSRVDRFNRWSIVGRYMKIVRNSNDDKHRLPEIELHIPRSPYSWENDLVEAGSKKTKKNKHACLKT
jgi:hypothetical protein